MTEQIHAGLRCSAAIPEASAQTSWPALIQKIQSNDADGMEELYRVFSRGVRFFLWRQISKQDLEDTVHDTFLIVAQAIRRGDVREPERLMGFVWTVVRRQLAARIERNIATRTYELPIDGPQPADRGGDPEWTAIVSQQRVM